MMLMMNSLPKMHWLLNAAVEYYLKQDVDVEADCDADDDVADADDDGEQAIRPVLLQLHLHQDYAMVHPTNWMNSVEDRVRDNRSDIPHWHLYKSALQLKAKQCLSSLWYSLRLLQSPVKWHHFEQNLKILIGLVSDECWNAKYSLVQANVYAAFQHPSWKKQSVASIAGWIASRLIVAVVADVAAAL